MQKKQYDIVGIGFGPSNLALAIAIEEHNQLNKNQQISSLFIEKKEKFQWHPGMMLPDSHMQIAFPKDLATYRNPQSKYTFFNYLFEKDRLVDFVNLKTFFPTRIEYADYLNWAASNVTAEVNYSSQVKSISNAENSITKIEFENEHNEEHWIEAKNVVVGMGLSVKIPKSIKTSKRIFHNYNILDDIKKVPSFKQNKIAILGAGQSAAEVITYFHTLFPKTEIHTIFSRFSLTPSDSTPYSNRIFDPNVVDKWYRADESTRKLLLDYHKTTNYSAVDETLIDKIYNLEYQELITGNKRIFFHNASNLSHYQEDEEKVHLEITNNLTQEIENLDVDVLICATGFVPNDIKKLLKNPENYNFNNNLPETSRTYQLKSNTNNNTPIYLNGCTEHLHGLSATLLSVTAVRVGEILNNIISNKTN